MSDVSHLRVLSIAHGAVRSDLGRIRYRNFVGRDDISVDLVAPSHWREYGRLMTAERLSPQDVRLHVEPIRLAHLPAINWYAHYYPRLAQIISRTRPHVIHLWEEPWSFVALQATRLRGDAVIVLEVDQNILKRLPPPFEQIRRHVLKRVSVLLARSREAETVARDCGFEGPVLPIGYGVDQNLFHPPATRSDRRAGDPLRLGYVGRLCEEKGLGDALDAVAAAQCPVKLSLMGEGPYEAQLRTRIGELGVSEKVSIERWSGLQEVANFLRHLDVSLLLSHSTKSWKEQFGRTIIESQNCGVPVIGSSSGAIPDVIGAGGWIVGERDPAAVAKTFEHIFREPDELVKKRAAGQSNVARRFTYAIVAQQLEAAWREAGRVRKPLQRVSVRAASATLAPPQGDSAAALSDHSSREDFKVVQVVRDISEGGGVETVAFELARAWQEAAVENLTIARSAGPHPDVERRTELVAKLVARVPTRGAYRYLGRLLVVPIFTVAATWALRRHRDAVVLSHGDSFSGDVLVVHAVNAASIAVKKRSGSWKWMFNPMHAWAGLRDRGMIGGLRYRHFIAVSPRAARELRAYYGVQANRITVIPNGIDLDRFKPDGTARQRIRSEFGIAEDEKLLLFVGHEFGRKGLAYAIAALEKLPDAVKLLVVGSDLRAPFERMFAGTPGRLIFAGERLDMPALYAAADAFLLPSEYETFALVGMEAMACGVPVFATMVGGIEDYLQDGVNGHAIERDGTDIAAKIAPILDDAKRLQMLAAGARMTAQSYAWPRIAARYTELLQDIWLQKRAKLTAKPSNRLQLRGRSRPRVTPRA